MAERKRKKVDKRKFGFKKKWPKWGVPRTNLFIYLQRTDSGKRTRSHAGNSQPVWEACAPPHSNKYPCRCGVDTSLSSAQLSASSLADLGRARRAAKPS